jgi:hypothetical protein
MVECKICNTRLKNTNGLAKHIHNQHSNISKEEYYNLYINESDSLCQCGNTKKFRDLGVGYLKHCSMKCRSKFSEPTKYWEGKKQPQEMIDKRRNTLIERYDVACGFLLGHSSVEKYKGFICRSTYEKMFIDFAEYYEYTISVPNKISYIHKNRKRWYFPDFYINELDLIIEIKSKWTWDLNYDMNNDKIKFTKMSGYDILIISEENGLMDKSKWSDLNEYISSR